MLGTLLCYNGSFKNFFTASGSSLGIKEADSAVSRPLTGSLSAKTIFLELIALPKSSYTSTGSASGSTMYLSNFAFLLAFALINCMTLSSFLLSRPL